MQIPGVQSFGTSIAPPPQAVAIPDLSTGQGLQAVGQAVQGIGGEERQRQDLAQRAADATTLAATSNDLLDAKAEVARGVTEGSIPSASAVDEYRSRAQKIVGQNLANVMPERRQLMDPHLIGEIGASVRELGGVVIRRQQSETAATIDNFGEQVARQAPQLGPQAAVDKFGAMVDFTGSAAGWTPEQMAAKKQTFAEKTTFAFFDAAGTDALTKGDVNGVSNVMAKVQGPDGDPLDPKSRVQLIHQLYGYQHSLLAAKAAQMNAAESQQRIRENAAVDVFNKGSDLLLKGGAFSPDFIREGSALTAGTSTANDWTNLLAAQSTGAGFATKSAPERAAIITQMASDQANPAIGTDPLQAKALQLRRTIDGNLRSEADANPWQATAAIHKIDPVPPITPGMSPAAAEQAVANRMAVIGNVEEWVGHKVSPLQPDETDVFAKMVRMLPYDQAARALAAMGSRIGDSDRVAAVAKQLGDKDGTLGLSMAFANTGTTQGRLVAELLMRGEQSLKDRSTMIDQAAQTGWKASIANAIDGAYSNREVEDQTKRAAYLVMAARANDSTQKDTSLEKAVQLVTGGIIERNGQKVPMPYGMKDEDAFNTAIGSIKPADLAPQAPGGTVRIGNTTMPLDAFTAALPKATLVHAGQGLYNVKAGPYLATNTAGKRITLRVTP